MRAEDGKDVLAALGCALRQAYGHVVREPLPTLLVALAAEVPSAARGDEA